MRAGTLVTLSAATVLFGFILPFHAEAAAIGGPRLPIAGAGAIRATAVSGAAPVLQPIADMTVAAGAVEEQTVNASDADGETLTFYKASGPAYMTVATGDTTSASTGLIRLAPGASVSEATQGAVGVTDGSLSAVGSFRITVLGTNGTPVLSQPAAMSVRAGQIANQTLNATDPNGDALTFSKVSGPVFMTVTTTSSGSGSATGNVLLAPAASNVGGTSGTVRVSDGTLMDEKAFNITVTSAGNAPILQYLYNMSLRAGTTADQSLYASDSDGDPITFSKAAGPQYMSVTTTFSGSGYAYGNLHLAPSIGNVGSSSGTVQASDGGLSDMKTLQISVTPPDRPPVMSQPADMVVTAGEIAEQSVTATDPDGDYISIYKSFGPSYMDVETSFGSSGTVTGIIRLSPGSNDVGVVSAGVTAYALGLSDQKTFTITVQNANLPPACPSGSFVALTSVFGSGLIEVQSADFDGDGILDILIEMNEAQRTATAHGIGDGSFGTPVDLDAGRSPVSGAIADFNRDEIPDVAVLDTDAARIWVFLGDGAGGFGAKRGFAVPNSRSLVASDVNRDGKVDLLVTSPDLGSVSVLRGNGDGTFGQALSIPAGFSAWQLATPDLNRDGAPDLVVTNPNANIISVLLNTGTGLFSSRTEYTVGITPLGVSSSDLNGDGNADVVVSNASSSSVSVLLGRGDGTLGTKRSFSTHIGPRQIGIADWNGDGKLDIATANIETNDVSILLGDGAGAFGARTDAPVGRGPYGVATGDFNDDLRPDMAIADYYDGAVTVLLNTCAPTRDHPPVVHAPVKVTGSEGVPIVFAVTATDPDGPAIASFTASFSGLPLGNTATFTDDASHENGQFSWTPGFQDSRPTPYTVTFTAQNVLSGSATVKITVQNTNRAPVANAGGPYTAFVGAPLTFNGTGSVDPDGDAMTYGWVFGDGFTGTGVQPVHTYTATGTYGIALSVSDGSLTGIATTTATVVGLFETRAFTSGSSRTIKLGAGKPVWCATIEPVGRSYVNTDVDLATIVMKSAGTGSVDQIFAIAGKTTVGGDRDANGVEEINACFAKSDLRLLFADLRGTTTVTVTIEARLRAGGIIRGRIDVGVSASGGHLAASITPNPLNPEAVLTFRTGVAGFARVTLYDVGGRLVRRILDEPGLEAGYHDLRVNARTDQGQPLSSGVYFYRIEAAEGVETGRFTVLK